MLPVIVIREMPIKTTVRYCLTPTPVAVIKETDDGKCWHCQWDVTWSYQFGKDWQFFQTWKFSCDPVSLLVGMHENIVQKRMENTCPHKNLYTSVHHTIILDSQKMEATQMPISCGMDTQMWSIHTVDYYSAIRKE